MYSCLGVKAATTLFFEQIPTKYLFERIPTECTQVLRTKFKQNQQIPPKATGNTGVLRKTLLSVLKFSCSLNNIHNYQVGPAA